MEKQRLIVLTDIARGPEVDDIQSALRLLLYSDVIDIEGLIACTSCFLRKGARPENAEILLEAVEAYGKVRENLLAHAPGYPGAEDLRAAVCCGIPAFGWRAGIGFAQAKYSDNPGVRKILEAADREDGRPLWIALWGGANTLAQAVWQAQQTRSEEEFSAFLSRLRIYSISDQDYAGRWLRENFGDRLFYIVTPSDGSWFGSRSYYRAAWPGISADRSEHGSEDGETRSRGFSGGDFSLIDNAWIEKNVIGVSGYGRLYPYPRYITEGDTPSFLGLIPNGLNEPGRPDYGGWGGRYAFYRPEKGQPGAGERHPIWTNASDAVFGADGKKHVSPQATVWRWRRAFQSDFAARMLWTASPVYGDAPHAPSVRVGKKQLRARPGETLRLAADIADPDGDGLGVRWYQYREAGTSPAEVSFLPTGREAETLVRVPKGAKGGQIHVIAEATKRGPVALSGYCRFVIDVSR